MKQLKAILTLFLLLLLSACQTPARPTTVSLMVSGDPAERAAYQTLVAAFHAAQPHIQIEMTHIPADSDYRTRLTTDFAAGTPPDISLMNYRRVASFAANGLLEPLGPFLDSSPVIQPADFYAPPLEAFTWQGTLLCLPQNISSLVVYYNQNLFDAAGVAYPPDSWRWDDFVAAAKALTRDLNGDGISDQYGLGVEPSLYRLAPFIWQNNAPLVDDEQNPTRLMIGRFSSLEAVQWFVALRQVHGVVPDRIAEAAQDSESRFVAGTMAMLLDSRRGTPTYRQIEQFTWDVAPLPEQKTAAGILHSDGYCLAQATQNKAAAWTFIEFASSVPGQTIMAHSGRTVPSLRAVAESEAFLDPTQPPARSRVWLETAVTLRHVPLISTWPEIEAVASEEIERAFYGDVTVQTAVELATQRTEEYFFLGITSNSAAK